MSSGSLSDIGSVCGTVTSAAEVEPVFVVRVEVLEVAGLDVFDSLNRLDLLCGLEVLGEGRNEFFGGDVFDGDQVG